MLAITGLGAAGLTQYGLKTAEIEVVRFDSEAIDVESAGYSPETRFDVFQVAFRYLSPSDASRTRVNLHFDEPVSVRKNFQNGQRFRIRYRVKPLLGLEIEDPNFVVIQSLGLERAEIEQIIVENTILSEVGYESD